MEPTMDVSYNLPSIGIIPDTLPPTPPPAYPGSSGSAPYFHTDNPSGNCTVVNVAGTYVSGDYYDYPAGGPVTFTHERANYAPTSNISRHFAGRERELQAIRLAFASDANSISAPYAVYGEAGIGKTQLALRFAEAEFASGTYSHIFFISGTTLAHAKEGLEEVFGIVQPSDVSQTQNQSRFHRAGQRWLEEPPAGSSWLLIADRVTHESVNFLTAHLPHTGGDILLTTQSLEVAEAFRATVVQLGPLALDDAVGLLLSEAGMNDHDITLREQGERIAEKWGCLPIPICQAGRYAHNHQIGLPLLLQASLSSLARFDTSLSGYDFESFASAVQSQYNLLHKTHPLAAELLKVLSYFALSGIRLSMLVTGAGMARAMLQGDCAKSRSPLAFIVATHRGQSKGEDTSRTLLDAICDAVELHNLLRHLQHLSLVQLEPVDSSTHSGGKGAPKEAPANADHMLRMHPLVRDIIRESHEPAGSDRVWFSLAVDIVISAFLQTHHRGCLWCPYAPHVFALAHWESTQSVHHAHYLCSHRRFSLHHAARRLQKWKRQSCWSMRETFEDVCGRMAFAGVRESLDEVCGKVTVALAGLTLVPNFAPMVARYQWDLPGINFHHHNA
ncbi:hypothetical protein HWV62_40738 [Athelia sp. TMB]|nr:hypothetical protein HWV62_40738 [Athelia sp. TMB]